ncbi:uncharacterized protein [Hetaerina americana]|uniref:uncharacterized protein n=1 Tax=Hetaerina americana TaxID=62018 RepID=UPI003A7F4670
MAQKEEDTVVLLSPIEVEEDFKKEENSPSRRPFMLSGISSCFLCGLGLFIANTVSWCNDPEENCKHSQIFRVTALFGGIISSLIVGRAVDYYGRRFSLILSALLWILVTIFMVFLPPQTELRINSYDGPLFKFYTWPTELRSSSLEYAPTYTIKKYDTEVSVSHIISYSYSQNSSTGNHFFPTQTTPIKSVSIQNYGSYLNPALTNDNLAGKSFSSANGQLLEYSSLKSVSNGMNLNRSSISVPLVSCFHLFLGAASAASIVAASIYTYETSPINSQGRWLSLSDFLSSLFILCLPIIHGHFLLLALSAWVPIIVLGFLMLVPIYLPDCLSLPQSPHFLLLSIFIQRRNSLLSNSVIVHSNENKGVPAPGKVSKAKQFGSNFQSYSNVTLGYMKTPFKKAKIKIHDASSKSSASESDDSNCFFNDKLKHMVLESADKHLQNPENEGGTESIHHQESKMGFPKDNSCDTLIENFSGRDKNFDRVTELCGNPKGTVDLIDYVEEEGEEEYSVQGTSESNEINYGCEMQGECANLVQQNWPDSKNATSSWQERESLRILSYLNGKKEGYKEWKNIKKMLKEDATVLKYLSKNTFFQFDISSVCSTLWLVTKVGLPIMIIHLFSCEYGAVVTLSDSILSKLGFCDLSGAATITSLQVVSSGASLLILDKMRNQVVLKIAAIVMTLSLITLGFLLPSVQKMAGDEQLSIPRNAVTPSPALPTLYPLLPTPLPQVLQGQENMCPKSFIESSRLHGWDQVGMANNGQNGIPLSSLILWFSALALVLYVLVSSLVLLPLTRLMLVSSFPIDKRGSGVSVSFTMEWVLRLLMLFFPYSFLNSILGFSLYVAASLSSIFMLCVTSSDLFSKDTFYQRTNDGKKISHHSSYGKVCNLSDMNSTAV